MKIISYGNKETQDFDLNGILNKMCPWRLLAAVVRRKLDILICGITVEDFKVPPGNRFEWLRGDLKGKASIRINSQWRIVFKINRDCQLEEVQIIDYHK